MDNNDQISEAGDQTSEENGIQEGDIIKESSSDSNNTKTTVLDSLKGLIRENLTRVTKLTDELKQQKEMIESVLENDETYKQHKETAKQASKIKSATKTEILKRPDVSHIAEKVRALADQIKEIKESMSSYLTEYQRLSGSAEIKDNKGEIMEIVYVAKLVKRRS